MRAVAAVGEIDLLDAVHAGPGDARPLLAFGFQEAVDVTAVRRLAVELDVEAGKDVVQSVHAALKVGRRANRSGRDFEKAADVSAIHRQVADLGGVQSGAGVLVEVSTVVFVPVTWMVTLAAATVRVSFTRTIAPTFNTRAGDVALPNLVAVADTT